MKLRKLSMTGIICAIVSFVPFTHIFAAQFLFTPELTLREEYNDNIFLTPENEVDDYITAVGLGLNGQIIGKTTGLELSYIPQYTIFADNSDLDYWRHEARLHFWSDLARYTRLMITDDFLRTNNPTDATRDVDPEDPSIGPGIGTDFNRRGRNEYMTNTASIRLEQQFGARDTIYGAFQHRFLEDIDTTPGVAVDDFTELRPSLGLEYWFGSRWSVELEGFYSDRTYDDRNDREEYYGLFRLLHAFNRKFSGLIEYYHTEIFFERDFNPDQDQDYKIYQPAAGFRYQFQDTGRFTLSVGYLFQDVKEADSTEEEGWVVNSELYKRWNFRRSYISFNGGSGYEIADQGSEDLGLNIYYTGSLTLGHNFTSRLAGEIYGAYRYDDYPDSEPDRVDKYLDTGVSVRYQMLRWMNVDLNYRFRDAVSDVDFEEYRENRVWMTITMAPSRPFRWN